MTLVPEEAIVLAGGAGTRLRSVLPGIPKVLAPVRGRPFLDRLLAALAAQGIKRVVLATGYRAEDVESAASAAGVAMDLAFSRENAPLGTGGAVAQAFDSIRGGTAWVFNGDSYSDLDLEPVARSAAAEPADAWIVAVEVADTSRFGALSLDGSRVEQYLEKTGRHEAGWINAGIYILPRALMPSGACSMERDLFPRWVSQGRVHAVKTHARFIDIGTPESLIEVESFFEP